MTTAEMIQDIELDADGNLQNFEDWNWEVAKELAKIVWHMLTKNEPYKGFKGCPTRVAPKPGWPQPISPRVRLADVRP